MYRNILLKPLISLLPVILTMITVNVSVGEEWSYVGIAVMETGDSYYLFLNRDEPEGKSGIRQFKEKHIFNKSRYLPTGTMYNTVVITREAHCKERKITDVEAEFSSSSNSVVERYRSDTDKVIYEVADGNKVNNKVFRLICNE